MSIDGGGAGPGLAAPSAAPRKSHATRPHRPVSVVGVLGELLITAGVFVLMFLGWQVWLGDIIAGAAQDNQAHALSQSWQQSGGGGTGTSGKGTATDPTVGTAPGNAVKFGILYVPRFGATWERPIAQGIGVSDVLDAIGVGHYPGTAMPGGVGNFAIAAHRHAYGGSFENLHTLHVGDNVYIGTKDGWYEYTFRDIQYVQPTEVGVLDPVPMEPHVAPVDRLITMTTCNPFFSTAERMIAYGEFDQFFPIKDGPPSEIAATVNPVS